MTKIMGKKEEKRDFNIKLYLNSEEKKLLNNLSLRQGVTKSKIIRNFIKNYYYNQNDVSEKLNNLLELNTLLLFELRQQGNNLNQIAKHLNSDIPLEFENENLKKTLSTIQELLIDCKSIMKKCNLRDTFPKKIVRNPKQIEGSNNE